MRYLAEGPIEEGVSKLLVTTVPGLEDLLLIELQSLLPGTGALKRGKVIYEPRCRVRSRELSALMSRLTLAEKVHIIIAEGTVTRLEDVREVVRSSKDRLAELASRPLFFAVEASREGQHPFTSIDVAKEVGSAIQELFPHLLVSLDDPDVLFHVELVGREFRLAIDLTPFTSLKERGYRVYVHPSSLNPIVARAMCRISGLRDGEVLLDPMCGSGTVVIEALLDKASVWGIGFDVHPGHVRGALMNAAAAGVVADFGVADARRISTTFRGNVDVVITNPPYGIREKAVGGLVTLYRSLVEGGRALLNDEGRMVVLTPLRAMFERIARKAGWSSIVVREIEMGGLTNYIFLLKR